MLLAKGFIYNIALTLTVILNYKSLYSSISKTDTKELS